MKILDCTLRDGGYYTNWDFDEQLVQNYIECTNNLPIDYIEIGYRNPKLEGYYGKYFFCNLNVLKKFRKESNKKISIMLNQKSVTEDNVISILEPAKGLVDLVRIALDPKSIEETIPIAEKINDLGIDLALNVMYASQWCNDDEFISNLSRLSSICKYIYFVDSYGSMFPEDVRNICENLSSNIISGFHGHNNMQMGLSNTLEALKFGVGIVDSTMTGMGRGAGNLSTELLLTVLNKRENLDVDFDSLSKIVSDFTLLKSKFGWGTSLPYMFSGVNSFPQKQVMDWITKRFHSFGTIIKNLSLEENYLNEYEDFSINEKERVLLVGGGDSIRKHEESIILFLKANPDVVVVHASSRNAECFQPTDNEQIYCLAGNEGKRVEGQLPKMNISNSKFVLASLPSEIDVYVPDQIKKYTSRLREKSSSKAYGKTHTGIAVQTIIEMQPKNIFVVGYDGYEERNLTVKEIESFEENTEIFENFVSNMKTNLISLTKTKYEVMIQDAVFNYLP